MELSTSNINCIVETLRRNSFKASNICEIITNAWGPIISEKRIRTITKEFKDGARQKFERSEGSGRRKSEQREELRNVIQDDIKEDNDLTVRELALRHDITKDMCWRIVKEDLGLKNVSSRWMPHDLSEDQMIVRVQCCESLKELYASRNATRYIVVTDEKWFYEKPLGNTVTRRCWVSAEGDVTPIKIARRTQSAKKFHVLMAITFGGMFHFKIMEQGVSITSKEYTNFLTETINKFNSFKLQQERRSIPWEYLCLQHDNATPHVSRMTTEFLQKHHATLIKQSPYSPDLNICDRLIFPMLEMKRSKLSFQNSDALNQFLNEQLGNINENIMNHELERLIEHLNKIIDLNGSYV